MSADRLTHACFESPGTIHLEFVDGRRFSLAASKLEIPMDRIVWATLKASPEGEMAVVQGIKGDAVPIDSGTLRYLVDEKYAATIDESINSLLMTPEEANEASRLSKATRDPRWNDVGDEDDLFE